jgi:hypothetical protein
MQIIERYNQNLVILWKNTRKDAQKLQNSIFKYGVSRLKNFFSQQQFRVDSQYWYRCEG